MILNGLSIMALGTAGGAVLLFIRNLPLFRAVATEDTCPASGASISVLIPARDEAAGIEAAINAALASTDVTVEIVVLDDHSSDQTPNILARKSAADSRVRSATSAPLPEGWNGKQYACRQLADLATHDVIVFIDADVRLRPTGLATMNQYRIANHVALLSAFPRQITGTMLEKMIIPMMHFILLCFLPIARMRRSRLPSYASGCGQLFMTDRASYVAAGTHAALKSSRHDGLKLPRAYRQSDQSTDVIDGTEIASCRMYTSGREVIRGVLKNAIEGIANPRLILPFTIMLLSANALPIVTFVWALNVGNRLAMVVSLLAIGLAHLPRLIAAIQLRQSLVGAMLHVPAVVLFIALQWIALFNHARGRQISWRGRS